VVLIKKINVKEHFATRRRLRLIAARPASESDATGFSEAEPVGTGVNAPVLIEDFLLEHSSSSAPVASIAVVADGGGSQAPKLPGSPRE